LKTYNVGLVGALLKEDFFDLLVLLSLYFISQGFG